MNGEHFAVMGGTGFDALMIKDADDNQLKEKFGRVGYVRATIRSTKMDPVKVRVELDGREWFSGKATCVLVGNVGTILGGVTAFADASPTDGRLDVGVVQAKSRTDWMRVAARGVTGRVGGVTVRRGRHGREDQDRTEEQDAVGGRWRRPDADQDLQDPLPPRSHPDLSAVGSRLMSHAPQPHRREVGSDQVEEFVHEHPGLVRFARIGWVSKGIVYALVGVLALTDRVRP